MHLCRNFLSHSAEKNAEEPFSVSFYFGYGKNLCIRGVYHDVFSKIFASQCRKKSYRNLLVFH